MGLAQAEVGKNFDTVDLGNGLTQWTSHYDRIWDGDSWENYIISNNPIQLEFESGNISFVFDKVSCDFKLLDPESKGIAIEQYDFTLNIDGFPTILPICTLESFLQSEDRVSFTINQGLFKTLYDMNPSGSMEWTHEIDNNEGKASTFTIIETCTDCIVKSIDGNRIDFGLYTLDTKNEVHNTVKETRADKGDYIIVYEKTILDKEKLVIDPTFTINNPTEDTYLRDDDDDDVCQVSPSSVTEITGAVVLRVGKANAAAGGDCYRSWVEFPISSIPDGVQIINVDFDYDISSIAGSGPDFCDYIGLASQPTIRTPIQIWGDINSGTVLSNADNGCDSTGINKSVNLGASGNSYVQSQLPSDWLAIGIKQDIEGALDGTIRFTSFCAEEDACTPDPTITITYQSSDAITDLTATDIRSVAVDLAWSAPSSSGTITGYQINSTTPWNSNVATIRTNNTGTATTSVTVPGLTGSTQYSFRVAAWVDSVPFVNATGNVLNITTDFDPTSSFTPGTFSTNFTGTDVRDIKYQRTNVDDTTILLNVTADNDFELACNFHYRFANTNNTHTNIANVSVNANEDMASFQFNNVDNEIINVLCWDQYTNASAPFLLTQTAFPLLEQLQAFRSGEFGTSGNLGIFDFITLTAIILSMMGMNRVNETVGVVFSIIVIGGLSVFQIIPWYSTLTASLALILIFTIASTRKD